MSKETMWMIIASIAPLVAVTLIYIGLQDGGTALAMLGLLIFALGMLITPVMWLLPSKE